MIAHNIPRPHGQPPAPMLEAYLGGAYEEMYKSDEAAHFTWFNRYLEERIKLDYWWLDAGWYKCDPDGWPKVGTWEVDKRRFPAVCGPSPITSTRRASRRCSGSSRSVSPREHG